MKPLSEIGIKKVKQVTGVSYLNASIQFYASKEYKDLTFHTYKVANCKECALIMLSELRKNYLTCIKLYRSIEIGNSSHLFYLFNTNL
jgi:hypothetical protein